jgi:hypothetical protein
MFYGADLASNTQRGSEYLWAMAIFLQFFLRATSRGSIHSFLDHARNRQTF